MYLQENYFLFTFLDQIGSVLATCKPGQYYTTIDDEAHCRPCDLHTYKPVHGPDLCRPCPDGGDGRPGQTAGEGQTECYFVSFKETF